MKTLKNGLLAGLFAVAFAAGIGQATSAVANPGDGLSATSGSFRPSMGAGPGNNTASPTAVNFRPSMGAGTGNNTASPTAVNFRPSMGAGTGDNTASPTAVSFRPSLGAADMSIAHDGVISQRSDRATVRTARRVSQEGHRAFRVRR